MNLTDLECDILDHMWLKPGEPVRIRDLLKRVNEGRSLRGEPPYAYPTVATVVYDLRDKGVVVSAGSRTAGYLPVYTQASRTADRMRKEWDQAADPEGAMLHFLSGMTEEQLNCVKRSLAAASPLTPPASQRESSTSTGERPTRRAVSPPSLPSLPSLPSMPPAPSKPSPPSMPFLSDEGRMREEARRDPNALIRGLLELQMKAGKTTRRALADRIGIHVKTVANRMARAAELPLEELEELVHGLEPPDDIRAAIFRLAGRVAPPQYGIDPRCLPDMPTRRAYVDSIQRPSVLYTIGWRVVYCNKAYKELFAPGPFIPDQPGAMPLSNGVEYILFHRHAARLLGAGNQRAYDRHWRTLALAHVAAVDQSNSGDPDLKRILRRINERPNLRQAYRSAATWIREHGDVAVSSEPRPFFDPRTGQSTRAHVLTEAHENSPLQHATWMIDGEPDVD